MIYCLAKEERRQTDKDGIIPDVADGLTETVAFSLFTITISGCLSIFVADLLRFRQWGGVGRFLGCLVLENEEIGGRLRKTITCGLLVFHHRVP